MSTRLILDNLVAYSLQIGLLVGVAAAVPALLRLRQPGARLIYWQILLLACILLPLQPWQQVVLSGTVETALVTVTAAPAHLPIPVRMVPRSEIALSILLAGMVVRLAWLAVGFWKLGRYRRHSVELDPAPTWSVEASLRVCDDIASPVTFGWRKPVVLLPGGFAEMTPQVQDAILCHEVMHVRRSDWLFTVAEELVRAVFWFHPAVWWLLGEIGLSREQEVDRLAIEITHERDQYMDALLAIAGARSQLDLAPAPLFLRKRHLRHRVVMILKEGQMSKQRLISTLSAGLVVLVAACWLVTGAFPLTAQPQIVTDAPGVTVNLNGATVMHRTGVEYPMTPRQRGAQGTVSVQVTLDETGNVSDARVLSGPDELHKPVLQSVLQWHFSRSLAGTTRVVGITFEAPVQSPGLSTEVRGVPAGVQVGVIGGVQGGVVGGVLGGIIGPVPAAMPRPTSPMPTRISAIRVLGLPEMDRAELLATLPVHEGDEFSPDLLERTTQAARAFDEHLTVQRNFEQNADGAMAQTLTIAPPGVRYRPAVLVSTPRPTVVAGETFKVGGNVQSALLIRKVTPVYPPLAKSARVEGVVHLGAIIGKDGTVQELHVISGPALLQQAAMDAVKEWVYSPTLMNNQPAIVETTIDVNFTLAQ